MVRHAAERLEQVALCRGLDTCGARQARQLRHDPGLLGRGQRFVLEPLLENACSGLRIATLLDEARERPGGVAVIRAQREHALVGGAGRGRVAHAGLEDVARGHQRCDLEIVIRGALRLTELGIRERARIVIG